MNSIVKLTLDLSENEEEPVGRHLCRFRCDRYYYVGDARKLTSDVVRSKALVECERKKWKTNEYSRKWLNGE